nr:TetR-like C-terminal domain-containing protein [Streptomyces lushanensis]
MVGQPAFFGRVNGVVPGHPAPPAVLHRALTFWTRLHGVLSLELAGHFAGMGFDPERLFAAELDELTGPSTH